MHNLPITGYPRVFFIFICHRNPPHTFIVTFVVTVNVTSARQVVSLCTNRHSLSSPLFLLSKFIRKKKKRLFKLQTTGDVLTGDNLLEVLSGFQKKVEKLSYQTNMPLSTKAVQGPVQTRCLIANWLFAYPQPKNIFLAWKTGSKAAPTLCWSRTKTSLRQGLGEGLL